MNEEFQTESWTPEMNQRRCRLIDKAIEESLTDDEKTELHDLQEKMLRHRKEAAPLPIKEVEELRDDLREDLERKIIHILNEGFPLCGFSSDFPVNWPEGHVWTRITEPEKANCAECKKNLPK